MKIQFSFLSLVVSFVAATFSTFAQNNHQKEYSAGMYQSIAFKPFNYSKIPLGLYNDDVLGISVGIEYERQFQNHNNWSWVMPITFTRINNFIYTDYYPSGFQAYICPGVKYYPRGSVSKKGYHLGFNTILGFYDYDFSAELSNGNRNAFFSGILANNHYTFTFGKRSGINIEAGLGLMYSKVKGEVNNWNDFPPYSTNHKLNENHLSLIGNFSIAWIYAFQDWEK